jgi:DNA-binding NarL/FixJ family response regulator
MKAVTESGARGKSSVHPQGRGFRNCGERGEVGASAVTPKTERTAVIFDHSQLWLHSLERALPAIGITTSGRATSADEAVLLVKQHTPNLLIAGIDRGPNVARDLSCVRLARERVPELQVIVWSNVDEPQAVKAAFASGAAVYVLKTARPEDILLAIRQTSERSFYLADDLSVGNRAARAKEAEPSGILTRREIEILQLLAQGHSNAQLAQLLWVTEDTVKFHLSNIYQKLDVANRTEASRWAHVHGVVLADDVTPTGAR